MGMEINAANALDAVTSLASKASSGLSGFAHKAMGLLGNITGGLLSQGAQQAQGASHSGGLGHIVKDLGEAALTMAAPEIGLPLKAAEMAKDAFGAGKAAETIARDFSPAEHEAAQAAKAWGGGEPPAMSHGAPQEMSMSDHPTRGGLNESYYHPETQMPREQPMEMTTRGPMSAAEHFVGGAENFLGGAHNFQSGMQNMMHPFSGNGAQVNTHLNPYQQYSGQGDLNASQSQNEGMLNFQQQMARLSEQFNIKSSIIQNEQSNWKAVAGAIKNQ